MTAQLPGEGLRLVEDTIEGPLLLEHPAGGDWWDEPDPFAVEAEEEGFDPRHLLSIPSAITADGIARQLRLNGRIVEDPAGTANAGTRAQFSDFLDGKTAGLIDALKRAVQERWGIEMDWLIGRSNEGAMFDTVADQVRGGMYTVMLIKAGVLPRSLGAVRLAQKASSAAVAGVGTAEGVSMKVTKLAQAAEMAAMTGITLLHQAERIEDPGRRRAARMGASALVLAGTAGGFAAVARDFWPQYQEGKAFNERRAAEQRIFAAAAGLIDEDKPGLRVRDEQTDQSLGWATELAQDGLIVQVMQTRWGDNSVSALTRPADRMEIALASAREPGQFERFRVRPDGQVMGYSDDGTGGGEYSAPTAKQLDALADLIEHSAASLPQAA